MIKQLKINGKASYDDFDLYIRSRDIPAPTPKKILEPVPFGNLSYDFSEIYGEMFYEDLLITYTFDVAEYEVTEMQREKDRIITWLIETRDSYILDDYIHEANNSVLKGSFESFTWEEEGPQGLLSVTFRCYPYKFIDDLQTINTQPPTLTIFNNSVHRIVPTIRKASGVGAITTPTGTYNLPANQDIKDSRLFLEKGNNVWTASGSGNISFNFYPEVY